MNVCKVLKREDCRTFQEEEFNMDKLRTNYINICIFLMATVLKNVTSSQSPVSKKKIYKISSLN